MLSTTLVTASASEAPVEIVYFEDGSYLTVELCEMSIRAGGTKTANKSYTYTDTGGTAVWRVVLTGTFSYTGTNATCTTCTCSVTIYDSAWYQVSKTTGKSGGTATADVTMGYKVMGITMQKVPVHISLTCDADGNLS